MAFFDPASVTLTSATEAQQISIAWISPNFFELLGVQPLLGRTFSEEEAGQRQRLALISHRFWQTRFGGSAEALGAIIELDGKPSRVIGVMPETMLADADVWEAHTLAPDWGILRQSRGTGIWFVAGRLRPNATIEQAQSEMNASFDGRSDKDSGGGAGCRAACG